MAYLFNGTSRYFNTVSTPVTAAPLTISVWFLSLSSTANQGLVNICDSTGDRAFRIQIQGAEAGDPVRVTTVNGGGTFSIINSTTGYVANSWQHGCAVFPGDTTRTVYLNGGSSNTATGSIIPTSIDRIIIGASRASSGFLNYFNGRIAEVGIWNRALTQREVLALSKGVSCDKISSSNLVFYAPLIRNLIDELEGRSITNNGGASVIEHPRIYM